MNTEITLTQLTAEMSPSPPKQKSFGLDEEPGVTKLLFLGGCHVKGHMVNAHSSFVNLSNKVLNDYHLKTEVKLEAHVLIKHAAKVVNLVELHRPDILVFQLGNFELFPKESLSQFIKREFLAIRHNAPVSPKKTAETNAATNENAVKPPAARRRATEVGSESVGIYAEKDSWTELVESVKHWRHVAVCKLLRKSLIDEALIEKQTDELFEAVRKLNVPRVVILSPLPSSSKTCQWYRRKGAAIFEKYARKHNLGYLDTDRYLSAAENNFLDGMHLNSLGHEKLGYVLGIHLRNLILSPQAYSLVTR